MTMSRFLIPLVALAAMGGQAFAQTATPATPAKPAAPVTAPAAPAMKPAAPAAAQPAAAQAKKININTATTAELDTLKGIGEARSKKIIEERGKAKFKDFADLVKRGTLPANVEAEIKDKITF
ncbi:ComEA family DNA-binding protein [Bosea robiniae]|jgi:DNA uptake protein ComE-like DNA-binding protein|uniref:DNA uptake protein ComE n=1 Tax=Bosea robiniae TaxID=1036780 RepID=A0ABY0NWD9_9HYPH|nr:helix-hairpin-helix domain-containing protein [Bosea robiniae]SDF93437.1 DNA uptake protein ComE [Bosea robiniae]